MSERKAGSFQSIAAEDLLVRARRGGLGPDEAAQFERALGSSAALRVAHHVGQDFDRALTVQPRDHELLTRAGASALARVHGARRSRRRPLSVFALAAGLLFASGAAATGVWLGVTSLDRPTTHPARATTATPPPEPGQRVPQATGSAPERHESPPAGAQEDVSVEPATAAKSPSSPATPPRLVKADPRPDNAVAETEPTAANLFSAANAARRAGDLGQAAALYTELQRRFPASKEARVSHVSAGKVMLSLGRAGEAERQFAAYARSGARDLSEESLVGRADALARLGKTADEERVWRTLLEQYPSSVYAARARQRLAVLEANRGVD